MTIKAIFTTPIQSREWVAKSGAKGITHSVFFIEAGTNPLENFQGEMALQLTEEDIANLGKNLKGASAKITVRAFTEIRNGIVGVRGDLSDVTKPKAA